VVVTPRASRTKSLASSCFSSGAIVAGPFRHTAQTVELLRLRADAAAPGR
jgi:hypothetical protein